MRRATFALAFALAIGSFASMSSAAPTEGQQPPAGTPAPAATPTPSLTKPAKPKLTPYQRAMRACARMKDEQAKADCRTHAQAQAKLAPRKVAKRKPVPPAPAATPAAATN